MVPLAVDDIAILESTFGEGVRQYDEGGLQLVVLPRVTLPDGCRPQVAMAIYIPMSFQGYDSRLFFESPITLGSGALPTTTVTLLLGRTMYATSIQGIPPTLPAHQAILAHLKRYRLPA